MFRKTALIMGIVFLAVLVGCGKDEVSKNVESHDTDLASAEETIRTGPEESPQGKQVEPMTASVVRVADEPESVEETEAVSDSPNPLIASLDPMEAFGSGDSAEAESKVVEEQPVEEEPVVEKKHGPYDTYNEAVTLLEQGAYQRAIVQLEGLVDEFAGDAVARSKVRKNLARAYLKLEGEKYSSESLPKARKWSAEALSLQPESSDVWNVRGRVLLASKRPAEAKVAFRKAIDLDPENVHAYNNLGYALILGSEFSAAVDPLMEAQAAAERRGVELPGYVFNNLGIALERSDRLAEAREAFQHAVDAGHPTAVESLARVESHLTYQKLVTPVEPEKVEPETVVSSSPM